MENKNKKALSDIIDASEVLFNNVHIYDKRLRRIFEDALVKIRAKAVDTLKKDRLIKSDIVMKDSKEDIGGTMQEAFDIMKKEERVNHPSHYTWLKELCGIEVIDITRHLDFNKGNAIKYLLRSGYKEEEGLSSKEKEIEDLKKAIWYIEDKIKMLQS